MFLFFCLASGFELMVVRESQQFYYIKNWKTELQMHKLAGETPFKNPRCRKYKNSMFRGIFTTILTKIWMPYAIPD